MLLFCAQTIQAFGIVAFHAEFFEKKPTIVVDAGHGGEDGGAVGVNGLVEKDVNLAIALALAEDLKAANFPVVLVREGDYSVGDQSPGHHRRAQALRHQEPRPAGGGDRGVRPHQHPSKQI